jgi:hypothetical protein
MFTQFNQKHHLLAERNIGPATLGYGHGNEIGVFDPAGAYFLSF